MRHIVLSVTIMGALFGYGNVDLTKQNQRPSSTLENSFIKEVSGYIRFGYQHNKLGDDRLEDTALGGKLSLQTHAWRGLSAGVSVYSTNVLFNQNDGGEMNFFNDQGKSYTLLGEAYLQGNWGNTLLKLGRQEFVTPYVSTDDVGMVPNTFEALYIQNKDLANTTLSFAHITKMSGHGTDKPQSFEKITEDGVQMAQIRYAGFENLNINLWYYKLNHEVDDIYFAEAMYETTLGAHNLGLWTQYIKQNYQEGNAANIFGALAFASYEPLGTTVEFAYNKVTGNKAINGFAGGPYYTNTEIHTLEHPESTGNSFRVGFIVDFSAFNIQGLEVGYNHQQFESKGVENPNTDIVDELILSYDFNENLEFSLFYSVENDDINKISLNNLRTFVNYSF